MQWNIHGNLGTTTAQSSAGAAAIARILNYLQPDVLLINEVADGTAQVNTSALTQWVTDNLPYLASGSFYVAVSTESSDIQRNAAISRYPILAPFTYADVSSSLRGMHSFQLQLTGTNRLQIFHVHLKCCSDGTSCQTKQDEAQLFSNEIATWAATNSVPYIFGGDLNEDEANPECPGFPTISTLRDGAMLAEFKPTTLSGEYRTWSTAPATPSIRFDYILAAINRLSPISGFVFSTMDWAAHGLYTNGSPQNLANDSRTSSDHYSVLATYDLDVSNFNAGQLSVTPAAGFAFGGPVGGPFNPNSQSYSLSNAGNATLGWTASNSANWLTLSANSGTLVPGSNTMVTASLNANANNLSAGNYPDTISFLNTNTGTGSTTRGATLTVNNPGSPFVGFFDDFSAFSPGNLVGQSNWTQLGTLSALPLQVSGGQVIIPPGQTMDNQDAYKNVTLTNGTVFYGLAMTVNSPVTNASPSYFAALYTGNNGGGFANFRLTAKAGDARKTNFVFGIRVTGQSGDLYTFGSTLLSTGALYRVIVQAPAGGASMSVYVEPTSSDFNSQTPYASNPVGGGTPPTSVGSLVISQFGTNTVANDGVSIGKVVVTDSFATAYNALFPPVDPFQTWQIYYFGSTNSPSAAAGADPDADGQNNWTEFLAGTDPTNSASSFRITGIGREGNDIRVTWMVGAGRTNALQMAQGDINGGLSGSFSNLFIVTNTSAGANTYLDIGVLTNTSARYYRVRLLP